MKSSYLKLRIDPSSSSDAILVGGQYGKNYSKCTRKVENLMSNNSRKILIPKYIWIKKKIPGKRIQWTNLMDVASLEKPQLRFVLFHTLSVKPSCGSRENLGTFTWSYSDYSARTSNFFLFQIIIMNTRQIKVRIKLVSKFQSKRKLKPQQIYFWTNCNIKS